MLPQYVKFYYDRLSDPKRDVYLQVYNALRNHKTTIPIKADHRVITPDDLLYIFECVYNDTPSFYFVDMSKSLTWRTGTGYIIRKDFMYPEEKIAQYERELLDGLRIFEKRYITAGMSDYEKEIVIHDYLVRTVTYDSESIKTEEQKRRHGEIYNTLGPLLRRKAVCWGISCAFKLLCDYFHIKCYTVIGDTVPKRSDAGHAWNAVRLDGKNYHVDVTWDLKEKGSFSFSYEYLNLNDALIRLDHTWDDAIYPPCRSLDYNYYHRNHLYVKSIDQLAEFVRKKAMAGERCIAVKYVAPDMPPDDALVSGMRRGFSSVPSVGGWAYTVKRDTHNIYIETKAPSESRWR